MALISCPECSKQISDKADVCINCGYPIQKEIFSSISDPQNDFDIDSLPEGDEVLVAKARSKMAQMDLTEKITFLKANPFDGSLRLLYDYERLQKSPDKPISYQKPIGLGSSTYTPPYAVGGANTDIHCPKCQAKNSHHASNGSSFSLTKAVLGGIVGGGVGAMVGGSSGSKYLELQCMRCGHKWWP